MKIIEGSTIKKVINIICVMPFAFQLIYGQEPPVEFDFNSSQLQAFYFFTDVTLNGEPIESDDWVAAFNGDVCVGARQWDTSVCGGGICDIPAMGDDGSAYSEGYMLPGEYPTFKVYDDSLGIIFDATPSIEVDAWSINGMTINDVLEVEWSVNEADYQYNGSITSEVHINGVAIGSEDDMLAAFIDGAIRGVANGMQSPFGNVVFPIMIYSNETSGETVEFVYYESSSNLYEQLSETLEFTSDMIIGNAEYPFIFTITSDDIGGCTDSSACNYNSDATDDDGSCEYPSGCDNACGSDLVDDACGVCDGDGSDDVGCGCFEDGPSGCDNTCGSELVDDCSGVCGGSEVVDECGICDGGGVADGACDCDGNIEDVCSVCGGDGSSCNQGPPDEFQFSASILQAFYFFTEVTLNGEPIESDDWVASFNGDVCVGARQWDVSNCGGGVCDVPIMGDDGSEYTTGYMQIGDIPTFKIYDASSGNIFEAASSEPVDAWSISGFSMNNLLEANEVILGCMDMNACNYDPAANESNESCEYPSGCDNTCGSDLVDDACGVCGGNESNASNCLSIDTFYVNNFSINSIYPNPFNPVVNIDLSIDIAGYLQLSVFTIEGIQIKTIYNGPSSVGESTFTWRPENRASGFYFISAVIGNQVKTKKVLFLK